jgi:hypothetical protein
MKVLLVEDRRLDTLPITLPTDETECFWRPASPMM